MYVNRPLASSKRLVKLDHKQNPSLAYTDVLLFRWDPRKAAANYKKHAIDFHEAATVLDDTLSTTFPDFDHSTPLEAAVSNHRHVEPRPHFSGGAQRGNRHNPAHQRQNGNATSTKVL